MGLESMLREVSRMEKDKNHRISLNATNEQTKLIDAVKSMVVTRGEESGGEDEESQTYGDGGRPNFRWGALSVL